MPRIEHKTENGVECKYCGRCKVFKPTTLFGNCPRAWDKLRPTCKDCLKEINVENKDKRTEYNKQYWENTKDQQKEKCKKWREDNKEYVKEKMKEWLENNKDHKKQKDREYRIANWDKKKESLRNWKRKDYQDLKTNPERHEEFIEYKIKTNTGRRIREILGQSKSNRCMEYVGCNLEQLKKHIEEQFVEGMSWDNYGEDNTGSRVNAWHIDHKIPCKAFNLSNENEVKACFNYRNLRPLWATENIVKSGTYSIEEYQAYVDSFITQS